jgi:hypothetical protein
VARPLRCLTAALLACLALGMLASGAGAAYTFRPRIGFAMGLVPPRGRQDLAVASSIPVVYHGGSVMRNVTVHTIFWAPAGYAFTGAPSAGTLGYQPLLEQFFTDAAHDSGTTGNVFSVTAPPPTRSTRPTRIRPPIIGAARRPDWRCASQTSSSSRRSTT